MQEQELYIGAAVAAVVVFFLGVLIFRRDSVPLISVSHAEGKARPNLIDIRCTFIADTHSANN